MARDLGATRSSRKSNEIFKKMKQEQLKKNRTKEEENQEKIKKIIIGIMISKTHDSL